MKILIAEDDAVSRRILEAKLAKWGYSVIVACDGVEAWTALEAPDAPRLAILNWMMPGMDGVEVCRKVRKAGKEPYTYIILLTALHGDEDLVTGMEAGADDYITKPFKADELRVRLRAGRRVLDMQNELIRASDDREALIQELRAALDNIKTLRGLLPICASCKKIRDDKGYWNQLEDYISDHSEALFTHGLCPGCLDKAFEEVEEIKKREIRFDK